MNDKESNFISAIVYLHNNEGEIEKFLVKINELLNLKFINYEIICVDDASNDESVVRAKSFASKCETGSITLVHTGFYQGLENAMNAGRNFAIGDFVFEFDKLTLDWDDEFPIKIYEHALTGFDIVSASNTNNGITAGLFYHLYNANVSSQHKLMTETFRILSRRAINRIHSLSKTIPYRKALYANSGLRVDTLGYVSNPVLKQRYSKHERQSRISTAINSLIIFSDIAWKGSLMVTLLFMFATLASGIYTIVIFIAGDPAVGFTTQMLLLSGAFFGVFLVLTIIIKYLSLIVDLIFKEDEYSISEIEKLK